MDILCSVCGESFHLALCNVSGLAMHTPVFCSPNCFSVYIERRVFALKRFGAVSRRPRENVNLSDASEADYAVWSSILRMSFRSAFESVVALYLYNKHYKFWYEKVAIQVGTKRYIPDFYLPESSCFIEVKGVWGAGSKTKYKKAAKLLRYHESLVLFPIWMKALFSKEVR